MLPSEERGRSGGDRLWRVLHPAGRETTFALEPAQDGIFGHRLVLPGPPGGWIVLTYSADARMASSRPMLRVVRREGAVQDFVLPGPALGRARWLGLIPDDATDILLSIAPGTVLERVGRRSVIGVVGECFARRPGHALAALYAWARGQTRRARDILRGGVGVVTLGRFEAWAAGRSVPYTAPGRTLSISCVVLAREGEGRALSRTVTALSRQTLAPLAVRVAWEALPPSATNDPETIRWVPDRRPVSLLGEADALCLLRAGDELTPDAFALLAERLGRAELVYADEVEPDGKPRLKPDWSPDLALATGYVGRPSLVARSLLERLPLRGLGPLSQAATTLDVAVAASCAHAVHVPRPLARTTDGVGGTMRTGILVDYLAATGAAETIRERIGVSDILWPLPVPVPLASIVIPSRDRIDLIRPVCRGVLDATDYPAIELILVDNGSTDSAVLAFYDELRGDPRVRILPFPKPFNFAAMVNAGVEMAKGDVVVLLNNDVAVRDAGWLGEMVRQAVRPEVGAVGAKLLFGDDTIQHAGVVVGLGGRAGHILRRRPADTPGHLGRLHVAHEVSAVTAACLAVATAKYRAVGGFDADAFPVDFNDVDFCLRLRAKGWKAVWTPAATLSHFESVSRGPSVGAKRERFEAEAARFVARWDSVVRHDPYYHPLLSLTTFGEDLE